MWRGHPAGTYLLCAIEFLERTSYYGMRGLLVLLMVAPVGGGGLGWSEPQTLAFYGLFTGAVWFSPLLGGLATDRWLGMRLAVTLGGSLLVLGYVALWAALVVPDRFELDAGTSLRSAAAAAGLPLGHWAATIGTGSALAFALQIEVILFMGGLALVVLGNAFFKPSVTLLVGQQYRGADPARERAYLLFYMSVYAAVLTAGVGIGTAGEGFGWASGLALATVSMVAALATYLARRSPLLSFAPVDAADGAGSPSAGDVKRALGFIGTHALFAMVFWAAYEQSGGLLNLVIYTQVDRRLGGWEVPATWFFSLTAVFAILVGPLLAGRIGRWETRHRALEVSERFALGLFAGALAFALMTGAASAAADGRVSILWPVGFYLLLTVGELLFSPTGFAMVGRIAPARHQSGFMGLWLLSVALGSYFGGQIGALSHEFGRAGAFGALALALAISGALMLAVRPLMRSFAKR